MPNVVGGDNVIGGEGRGRGGGRGRGDVNGEHLVVVRCRREIYPNGAYDDGIKIIF